MRTKLLIFALVGLFAASALRAGDNAVSLGLIAGPPAASETVLAANMANLFASNQRLRVLPMIGDSGAGNIALLLDDTSVDLAFVSTDALLRAEARRGARLGEDLELVARLYPQEVHVLARADIGSLADLAGRGVNFGPEGSSSAITAAALFEALGIEVEPLGLDSGVGLERLKLGAISAAVIVSGKPAPLVSAVAANAGMHLLPVPFGASLEMAYLPTRFEHADYPNLIQAGAEVATVATGMALLGASPKGDTGRSERIARFVETVFPRFAELQASDRHPKWREINLAASLPGYRRNPAAAAWLATHRLAEQQDAGPKSIGASSVQSPAPEDDTEALFKRFMQWQRAKGH